MEIKEIYTSPSNIWFRNGIHSLQGEVMPEGVLTSFTVVGQA